MMVTDTRLISERAQPDAYKLAARHESLYILIVADDNVDGRVAVLFLVFPSSLSILFPFTDLFSPFHLFPTRQYVPSTRSCKLILALWNGPIFRIENIGKKYAILKEENFSSYIFYLVLFLIVVLNNKFHKLIDKSKHKLEISNPKKPPIFQILSRFSSFFFLSSFSFFIFFSISLSLSHSSIMLHLYCVPLS